MALPTQHASIQAWKDEHHVVENRRLYREKLSAFIDILRDVCTVIRPPASFYVWLKTPIPDTEFTQQLFAQQNITVLPGNYLSRDFDESNPGLNPLRISQDLTLKPIILE
jgi:N-succinyldiaminopimelate aminotransferase